jgi:uncharacterized membrane protein (UPF0127 family)
LDSSSEQYQIIKIKDNIIYARVANTPELTKKGLMFVEHLDDNQGCLLDFKQNIYASLWMKNCKLNLQAATIDKYGKIVDILDMYYNDPNRLHHSTAPVRYVLEMPEHYFTSNKIEIGDSIILNDDYFNNNR